MGKAIKSLQSEMVTMIKEPANSSTPTSSFRQQKPGKQQGWGVHDEEALKRSSQGRSESNRQKIGQGWYATNSSPNLSHDIAAKVPGSALALLDDT